MPRQNQNTIQTLEEKLAAAKARQAFEDAKNDSRLAPIVAAYDDARNRRTELSRKNSGPQSFDNRRAKHYLWIDQISAEQNLNDARLAAAQDQVGVLKDLISTSAQKIQDGDDLDMDYIEGVLAISDPNFSDLEYEVEIATNDRKNHGKKKTLPAPMENNEAEAGE